MRRGEEGYTLVELIAVMAILLTVLTALTALFASGAKAELDANRRFEAQQEARLAVDRMRREIHCASAVALDRYRLRRAGTRIADYVTASYVFSYVAPSTSTRGRLTVDLPVNVNPSEGWKRW